MFEEEVMFERYQVVYATDEDKFYVIEDWDYRPSFDIPMSEVSGDIDLMGKLKLAFEKLHSHRHVDVVDCLRRDVMYDKIMEALIE